MSFHTLLGAFPVEASSESLDPRPHARVGELRASSRGGAMFRSLAELLHAVEGHEILRFLAHEAGSLPQRTTDPQTRWTVLDPATAAEVAAALDSLLAACEQNAADLASRVAFGADRLNAAELRDAMRWARDSTETHGTIGTEDDGDTAESVFAMLIGLGSLLRRAGVEQQRIAVFTWAPG